MRYGKYHQKYSSQTLNPWHSWVHKEKRSKAKNRQPLTYHPKARLCSAEKASLAALRRMLQKQHHENEHCLKLLCTLWCFFTRLSALWQGFLTSLTLFCFQKYCMNVEHNIEFQKNYMLLDLMHKTKRSPQLQLWLHEIMQSETVQNETATQRNLTITSCPKMRL